LRRVLIRKEDTERAVNNLVSIQRLAVETMGYRAVGKNETEKC
jgi:hypothetical protein